MATKDKPRRENPMTCYARHDLKRRAEKLAAVDPRWSVSRILETSLERTLPELEKELTGKA